VNHDPVDPLMSRRGNASQAFHDTGVPRVMGQDEPEIAGCSPQHASWSPPLTTREGEGHGIVRDANVSRL
jgi:hypothetical protein